MSDSDSQWSRSPILIAGHQRSGTNLLLSLLDSHPNLVVFGPGHLHLFGKNMEEVGTLRGQARLDFVFEQDIMEVFRKGEKSTVTDIDQHFDFETFREHADDNIGDDYSWSNIISTVFEAYREGFEQDKDDLVGFVENTPGTEHDFPIAAAFFPNAKALHILRDPRDVWASYKKAGAKGDRGRTVWQFIHRWNRSAIAAALNRRRHGDQYMVLDYDDLVHGPEEQMTKVVKFLDIPYTDSLLQPTKAGASFIGNSQHVEEHSGVSTASVGKYADLLSTAEINALDRICMPLYNAITAPLGSVDRGLLRTLRNHATIASIELYRSQTSDVNLKKYVRDYVKYLYNTTAREIPPEL